MNIVARVGEPHRGRVVVAIPMIAPSSLGPGGVGMKLIKPGNCSS